MQSGDQRYHEGNHSGKLEGIIDGGEGPVVLCGEYEVDEEYGGQRDHNAGHEDLYR